LKTDQSNKESTMNYPILYQWSEEIATHLPCLNSWQVANLALFSQGVIRAESCQQQQIARQVTGGERVESAARRLRRFLDNEQFPLERFFSDWTRWVVRGLGVQKLSLLVDETKLQDRLGVMAVGIAWQQRCIPLAWRCYRANEAAAYPAEGQVKMIGQLLQAVFKGLEPSQQVVVMADRGIGTSPDLCRLVASMDWYYLFRVTCQSKVITPDGEFTIADMVQEGQSWSTTGKVFKKRGRLPAHARAIWTVGHDQPWALVTNDASLTGFEYAQRNWQEQSFRDLKSAGWQWEASRIRHPDHMQRLLVLLVVAYAWVIALGSHAVRSLRAAPCQKTSQGDIRRHWSLFKEGLQYFVEYVQRFGHFIQLVFLDDLRFR
jgi:hypothetical protein